MAAHPQGGAFGHNELAVEHGRIIAGHAGRDEIEGAGIVQGRAAAATQGALGPVQALGDVQDARTGDRAPGKLQGADGDVLGERCRRISDIHGPTGHFQHADAPAVIQDELARAHADGDRADAADSVDLTRHTHGAVTAALITEHDAGTEKE